MKNFDKIFMMKKYGLLRGKCIYIENSHTPAKVRLQTTAELVRKIYLATLVKLRCSLQPPLRSVCLFSIPPTIHSVSRIFS